MKVVNRVEESELAPSGQVTSCLRANDVQFHRTEPVVTNREPVCKVLPGTIISLPTPVLCCIFNVYQNDYRVLQATTCVVNDPMLDSSTNADTIFPCTTKIDTLSGMLSVRVRPYGGRRLLGKLPTRNPHSFFHYTVPDVVNIFLLVKTVKTLLYQNYHAIPPRPFDICSPRRPYTKTQFL